VGAILAYLAGGLVVAAGIFIVLSGSFPRWTAGWMLLPVVNLTPMVARLLGGVVIALGASILALDVSTMVSELTGGILVLAGIATYVVAIGLFVVSTWLSRRPAKLS
jgi:hypothetical protein